MTFETSYLLEEFRAIQPELFDAGGSLIYPRHPLVMEDMLKLINQMEYEIKELEIKLRETYI
jgi:hypothetical protein